MISSLPTIELPEQLSNADWTVSIIEGSGNVRAQWRSTDGGNPNSVWDALPRPRVGTFTVRVRGPWGRGATRMVTLVEGLRVAFNPACRRFTQHGLQTGEARLAAAAGVEVSRTVIEYGPRLQASHVRVGSGREYQTLAVTPPHMTVAHQNGVTTSGPSIWPLRLFREDIVDDAGTLIVGFGDVAEPALHVVIPSGNIQEVKPLVGRHGVYRFDLARIVDTLTTHHQAQLALDINGDLVVATIRPRRLFRDAAVVGSAIAFAECVDVDGMSAVVYPTRAPWRVPAIIPVSEGRAELPRWLSDAGPLRIVVRIDDPWAPLPVAGWPKAGGSTLLANEGYVADDDPEAEAFSAFLAGDGSLPDIVDFARLWTVVGRLNGLALGLRIGEVADALERAVHVNPRAALLAVAASGAPGEVIAAPLIKAGLVWTDLSAAHDDLPPRWTSRSALAAALLSAADQRWSADEVEAAVDVCGDAVIELLGGNDRFAREGRLDEGADLFDRVPAAREAFVKQAALVPKGLLSGDARVIAAMTFVKERRDPRLEWLVGHAHVLLVESARMMTILGDPVARTAFDARRHPTARGGWRVVPAISLGLAFAARHAARGRSDALGWLGRRRRVWADLASVVPQMVTIDLIVAELLVAASSSTDEEREQ